MPLRSLPFQIIVVSLIVPIVAVFFAYQASVRWSGFSSVIKQDWESNFRADMVGFEAGEREEMTGMGKTPVYLYVWFCLDLMGFIYWRVYGLTRMK